MASAKRIKTALKYEYHDVLVDCLQPTFCRNEILANFFDLLNDTNTTWWHQVGAIDDVYKMIVHS